MDEPLSKKAPVAPVAPLAKVQAAQPVAARKKSVVEVPAPAPVVKKSVVKKAAPAPVVSEEEAENNPGTLVLYLNSLVCVVVVPLGETLIYLFSCC
jgi:hypothetical protein